MSIFSVGAGISTAINTTSNKIIQNLNTIANGTTNTICNISIRNVSMRRNEGCYLTIINECNAQSGATLQAVVSAATATLSELTVKEKEAIIPSLVKFGVDVDTTVNTLVQNFETNVTAKCNAFAELNQSITAMDFSFDGCKSTGTIPVEMKLINTGTAAANCAVNVLLDTHMDIINRLSVDTEKGLDLNSFLLIGGLLVIAVIVLYMTYKIFSGRGHIQPKHLVDMSKNEHIPWPIATAILKRI